jgi:hypothetical protein
LQKFSSFFHAEPQEAEAEPEEEIRDEHEEVVKKLVDIDIGPQKQPVYSLFSATEICMSFSEQLQENRPYNDNVYWKVPASTSDLADLD